MRRRSQVRLKRKKRKFVWHCFCRGWSVTQQAADSEASNHQDAATADLSQFGVNIVSIQVLFVTVTTTTTTTTQREVALVLKVTESGTPHDVGGQGQGRDGCTWACFDHRRPPPASSAPRVI